jgi:hypothetical protein
MSTALWIAALSGIIGGGFAGVVTQWFLRRARRDMFAAHALATSHSDGPWDAEAIASEAYRMADAMLAEREK